MSNVVVVGAFVIFKHTYSTFSVAKDRFCNTVPEADSRMSWVFLRTKCFHQIPQQDVLRVTKFDSKQREESPQPTEALALCMCVCLD